MILKILLFLCVGLLAGFLSGLIGIGGGVIIIPALIFLFSMPQHLAQGTTLAAFVPPIGILAAFTYYKDGNVDLKAALLISAGFVLGGLLGARFAGNIPQHLLQKLFAAVMFLLAFSILLKKG